MAHQVAPPRLQRGIAQPADIHCKFLSDTGLHFVRCRQHISPADVDVILQGDGNGKGSDRLRYLLVAQPDRGYFRGEAGGQDGHPVTRLERSGAKLPRIAAEVRELGGNGTDDILDRKEGAGVAASRNGNGLQVFQQGRPAIPGHAFGAIDDIVSVFGGNRNERNIFQAEAHLLLHFPIVRYDGGKHLFAEIHQVHLVDGHHDLPDAQQRGNEGMPHGLFHDAVPGVHQNHGQVGGRSTRYHIAGVLDVAGRIGNDEFPFRGGKIPISHVDGDALLAFGPQAIGEQRQVHLFVAPAPRSLFHGFELILENGFGIVQQATDQGAFSIVHAAGRGKPQHLHIQISFVVLHR